mmetsp:Transcript_3444/g.10695  ORF Transcript_3444/g.10695 Transcript_3444/m.10695 type:complete len:339 (+) Transcript_3444:67-1083(+)
MAISIQGLLRSEASLETQLALAVIWGLVWYVALEKLNKFVVQPFILSRPWQEQWTELNKKTFKASFMVEFDSRAELFNFACLFQAIMVQHLVGGALCLPALLGMTGPLVSTLACHGALCEAGWELQDAVVRTYQVVLGGAAGRAKNPTGMLVILGLHHTMGLGMVIPMNILHGDNPWYHEFVFLLQSAAAIAMLCQSYGYTLDVKTAQGLRQMKRCVTVTLITIVWSRVLRFAFVGFKLVGALRAGGAPAALYGGCLVLCTMGLINFLFTADAVGKFAKFMRMKHTDDEVLEVARCASSSFLNDSVVLLTRSQKSWAKVRGAVHLGAVRRTIVPNRNQ